MSDTTSNPSRMEVAKLTHHAWATARQAPEDPEGKPVAGRGKRLIGTVIGRASGIKEIKMPNGDVYEGLRGSFEATNAETGEITSSGICYLPSGFHDGVIEALRADDTESVDFAYKVFSVPAKNPAGYSYAMEPLLKPKASDPLAELRATVTTALLPAPAPAPTSTTGTSARQTATKAA